MINRLSVRNFKAFREQNLPLAPYTLLSGLNSAGKSTVLQALALLYQSRDQVTGEIDGFLLNGELVELGYGRDVLHEDYLPSAEGEGPHIEIGLIGDQEQERNIWSAGYDPESDLLPVVFRDRPQEAALLAAVHFQYLKADRVGPAVMFPRSYDAAVRRRFLGARGEHTVNFLRHHEDEIVSEELRHPAARSPRLADQTEAWLQEVCPGVNLTTDGIEGTDQVRLSFQFGTAGLSASNRYRPTNVGFGLTYALPIVVACLIARSGSIILLENPEAHVHPRGQTAMARLTCQATTAGAQVIVETHSDHILNGVRIAVKDSMLTPDEVLFHFFRRVSGRIQIDSPTIGPDGMISAWPDGFFDEWDRSLDRLLD